MRVLIDFFKDSHRPTFRLPNRMKINLRGAPVFMAQDPLNGPDVDVSMVEG